MTTNPEEMQALAMALGRMPSGLFILTARHGSSETGMLASWVQQCSFEPPQVTVAVRRDREILGWLTPGALFALNQIAEGQTNFLSHFGKGFSLDQNAFTGLAIDRPDGRMPILRDALGYLLCEVVARYPAGDHDLLLAGVRAGKLQIDEGKPMVHIRKNGLRY